MNFKRNWADYGINYSNFIPLISLAPAYLLTSRVLLARSLAQYINFIVVTIWLPTAEISFERDYSHLLLLGQLRLSHSLAAPRESSVGAQKAEEGNEN